MISEAAVICGFFFACAPFYHALCGNEPFGCDVVPGGGACDILENSAELGAAEIEMGGNCNAYLFMISYVQQKHTEERV